MHFHSASFRPARVPSTGATRKKKCSNQKKEKKDAEKNIYKIGNARGRQTVLCLLSYQINWVHTWKSRVHTPDHINIVLRSVVVVSSVLCVHFFCLLRAHFRLILLLLALFWTNRQDRLKSGLCVYFSSGLCSLLDSAEYCIRCATIEICGP